MLRYFVLFMFIFMLVGCAPESKYRGGAGSFKSYEGLSDYNNNAVKYKSEYAHGSQSSFDTPLVENSSVGSSSGTSKSGTKGTSKSVTKSSKDKDSKSGSYEPPVAGSGHFTPTESLMGGMRDSEAIQRATMKPYTVRGKTYTPHSVKVGDTFDGIASWYGPDFHAKATSNGETYNMHAHTAAHKTLPMNTIVRVFSKDTGKSTVVRINDRGPFVEGRIIDLSNVAAHDIAMVSKGVANVRLEVVGFGGDLANNKGEDSRDSNNLSRDSKIESKPIESKASEKPKTPIKTQDSKDSIESKPAETPKTSQDSTDSIESKKPESKVESKPFTPKDSKVEVKETTDSIESKTQDSKSEDSIFEEELLNEELDSKGNVKEPNKDSKEAKKPPKNEITQELESINKELKENLSKDIGNANKDLDNALDKLKDLTNDIESKSQNTESKPSETPKTSQDSKGDSKNEPKNIESKPQDSKQNIESKKGNFMISLNAFSSEQNANKFLQEISKNPDYSDYQADIVITDKGLYRVALRGFKTYDEAKSFIETHAIKGHIVKE